MPQKQKRKCQTDEQEEQNKKNIGQRFRLFRKSRNMTQKQLADHLSTSQYAVANIERGKYSLRFEHLLSMSDKFKLNPNWLLTGQGGMTTAPLEIPGNCRELAHLMNVPEVEERIFSGVTDLKKIFSEEIRAAGLPL